MKTSMLVESFRAPKIRVIVTIFLTIGITGKVLAVLLTHIMGLFFLLDPLLVSIIIAITYVFMTVRNRQLIYSTHYMDS